MDVNAVMEQIGDRLATITGLRVHKEPPSTVNPPAAVVVFPDITFDLTYRRGMDTLSMPVVLVISKAVDRVSRQQVTPYVSGSGAKSLKAVLEAAPTTGHWWVSGPLNLDGYTAPDYGNIPVDRLHVGDRFVYPVSHDKFTWTGATWNYDGAAGADGAAGQTFTIPAPTTYTAFDVVQVASVEFGVAPIGAIDYLTATFTLNIAGQGV